MSGGSWDSAARRYWRNANTDRELAQAAYETLGGEDELHRYLPRVWEQFAALAGGSLPPLPDAVTYAWEPPGLADNPVTGWTDIVAGAVLEPVVDDVNRLDGANVPWIYVGEDGVPVSYAAQLANDSRLVEAGLDWTSEGGFFIVGRVPDYNASDRIFLWGSGSYLNAAVGNKIDVFRDSNDEGELQGVITASVPVIVHVHLEGADWYVNTFSPDARFPAGPWEENTTGVGATYGGNAYFGPCDGLEVSGLYMYESSYPQTSALWRYIGARYAPVIAGGG